MNTTLLEPPREQFEIEALNTHPADWIKCDQHVTERVQWWESDLLRGAEHITHSYKVKGRSGTEYKAQIGFYKLPDGRLLLSCATEKYMVLNALNYHQAKGHLARVIAKTRLGYQSAKLKPTVSTRPGLKVACEILRMLRDEHGINFSMSRHPLDYYMRAPQEGDRSQLDLLWAKDRVYRAICRQLILRSNDQWKSFEELHEKACQCQSLLQSDLPKHYRRLLAQGKLSIPVALRIVQYLDRHKARKQPGFGLVDPHVLPKAFLGSTEDLDNYLFWASEFNIRSKHLPLLRTLKRDTLWHWNEVRELGLPYPHHIKDYKAFIKRVEDPTSQLAQAIVRLNTRHRRLDVPRPLIDAAAMEALLLERVPSLTSVKTLKDEEYAQEGKEMHHCAAMFAGSDCWLASVHRGDERVTIAVDRSGTWARTQCYGHCNSVTALSTDINTFAMHHLQQLMDSFPLAIPEPESNPAPLLDWNA